MVYLGKEKMSKSLGNLVLVSNLLQTHTADAVRVLLLSHHYRDAWEYTEADMAQAADRANRYAAAFHLAPSAIATAATMSAAQQAQQRFAAALSNDLDTPTTLGILDELASAANEPDAARCQTLKDLAGILGLTLGASTSEPA
jgi:L-cysteine:1D-myo-inositol 2-amino-2-deoxy-alpha-D-glucopyranoside ligase